LSALRRAANLARIASDMRSLRVLQRLLDDDAPQAGRARESVRLRPLGGRSIVVRPGTSDAQVVWDTFLGRYHRPPEPPRPSDGLIWDLGSNIGLTIADLAVRHPGARILGVEMDPDNAALARVNIAPWGERCDLMTGAVWTHAGPIRYGGSSEQAFGFRIDAGAGAMTAQATSLDALLERGGGGEVDFVKMDIEGAEREVLRENTAWAAHVRRIKVEVHDPYDVAACVADLERLGFRARPDRRHWACAIGTRG
jgi:FkbM family methyltransferase